MGGGTGGKGGCDVCLSVAAGLSDLRWNGWDGFGQRAHRAATARATAAGSLFWGCRRVRARESGREDVKVVWTWSEQAGLGGARSSGAMKPDA